MFLQNVILDAYSESYRFFDSRNFSSLLNHTLFHIRLFYKDIQGDYLTCTYFKNVYILEYKRISYIF